MTRAALLPAGADPFLNAYWLRHYGAVWANEVDELDIIFCGVPFRYQRDLAAQCLALPNVRFAFSPRADHGLVIKWLVEAATADNVLIVEDDAFIRRAGAVDAAFSRIEKGETDIVGCPRASATPDVVDAAINAFGNLVSETGEEGPALWPCFLFARRADLIEHVRDGHYGAAAWVPGQRVPGLDYRATAQSSADTFVGASYQLRAAGLRVHVEAEYRADLARMHEWDPPWFHVGSLSSGYGHYFAAGLSEVDRKSHAASVQDDHHDWNKRFSWWQRVGGDAEYQAAVAEFAADLGIDQDKVGQWRAAFDRFVTW